MGQLKYLVIHCLATPEGKDLDKDFVIKAHTDPPLWVKGVNKGGRGWKRPGYRDLVLLDGSLQNIVPHNNDDFIDRWEITNGVKGLNGNAAHIAYVGGMDKQNKKPKDTRTSKQKDSLEVYVKYAILEHPDIQILGHNEAPAVTKACPSFDVPKWLKEIGVAAKNTFAKVDGKNL